MSTLRRIRRASARALFIGSPPTEAHAHERAELKRRFAKLCIELRVKSDHLAFATDVLSRHMRGERRADKVTLWCDEVMALREDEAAEKRGENEPSEAAREALRAEVAVYGPAFRSAREQGHDTSTMGVEAAQPSTSEVLAELHEATVAAMASIGRPVYRKATK